MLTIGASLHLPSVFLSLFSWSSFYFGLRRLEPQRKAEWHCRTVTAFHALLITSLSGWSSFVQGPWPFTDAGGLNTRLQVTATTICLGYFLFDFAWCLYFQTEGVPMLLHHSLSVLGFVWTLCAGKYGTELMATICGSEVTNPLLQLRWFLKETGRYDTLLGEVVDALFMLSFFAVRLGVGSVLLYCYFQQPTDFMGRVGALSIYLISWMFSVSIFQYAVYKYTRKDRVRRQNQKSKDPGSISCSPSSPTESGKSRVPLEGLSANGDQLSASQNSCESVRRGESVSEEVMQNGLHHRSKVHVHASGETPSSDASLTEKTVVNGVLVNG